MSFISHMRRSSDSDLHPYPFNPARLSKRDSTVDFNFDKHSSLNWEESYQLFKKILKKKEGDLDFWEKAIREHPLDIPIEEFDFFSRFHRPENFLDLQEMGKIGVEAIKFGALILLKTAEKICLLVSNFFNVVGTLFLVCSALGILIDRPIHIALSSVLTGIALFVSCFAFAKLAQLVAYCFGKAQSKVVNYMIDSKKIENLKFWCERKDLEEFHKTITKLTNQFIFMRDGLKNRSDVVKDYDRLVKLSNRSFLILEELKTLETHPNARHLMQFLRA